jgi:hypothetical protein
MGIQPSTTGFQSGIGVLPATAGFLLSAVIRATPNNSIDVRTGHNLSDKQTLASSTRPN